MFMLYGIILLWSAVLIASERNPESVSVITFDGTNTLFIADTTSGAIFAYPNVDNPEQQGQRKAFNIRNVGSIIAGFLGVSESNMLIKDLAIHPITKEAYIAIHRTSGDKCDPAIVVVNQDESIRSFDFSQTHQVFELQDIPSGDFAFWNLYPMRQFVFTDIEYHKGKLYISGLSSGDFAATLRVISYPFDGKREVTSLEMYHANHGQNETRAPIRTMKIVSLNGRDYIVAAYTCTPLVVFPLDQLADGRHLVVKTVAELGYGNTPIDLISFNSPRGFFATGDVLMLTNKHRSAQVITLADVANSADKPGLQTHAQFKVVGVTPQDIPLTSVVQADNQDEERLAVLRRDTETNALQLFSFSKNLYFRKSDFVSEYDFPDYNYPAFVTVTNIGRHIRMKAESAKCELYSQRLRSLRTIPRSRNHRHRRLTPLLCLLIHRRYCTA